MDWIHFRNIHLINSPLIPTDYLNEIKENKYDRDVIEWFLGNVSSEDIILELGSSFGVISCTICNEITPKGYICVEPNPYMVDLLKLNHKENKINQIEVISGLASHQKNSHLEFYINANCFDSSVRNDENSIQKISVKNHNINHLIAQYKPTVLFCDIEESEYDLFIPDLDLTGIVKIGLELHGKQMSKQLSLINFLRKRNFILTSDFMSEGFNSFHLI